MILRVGTAVLFSLLLSVSSVSAQGAPAPSAPTQGLSPADSSLDNALQSLPRFDSEEAPLPGAVIKFPTQQPPANSATLKFVLSDVVIEGDEILSQDELRPIFADAIGEEVTLLEAFSFLSKVQAAHRQAGFVFTRVIAPPQSIEGGVFKIQVVRAVIGDVVVEEPDGPVGAPLPLIDKICLLYTSPSPRDRG